MKFQCNFRDVKILNVLNWEYFSSCLRKHRVLNFQKWQHQKTKSLQWIWHFINSYAICIIGYSYCMLYKWNLKANSKITERVPSYHQNQVHIKHSQNGIITQANSAFNFSTCIFDSLPNIFGLIFVFSNASLFYTSRTLNQPSHIYKKYRGKYVKSLFAPPKPILMCCLCESVWIWCECGGFNWIASMKTKWVSKYHITEKAPTTTTICSLW